MGKISQAANLNPKIKYPNNNSNQTIYPNNNSNQTIYPNNNYNQTIFPNNNSNQTIFPNNNSNQTVFPPNDTSIQIYALPKSRKYKYESIFKIYTIIMVIVSFLFGCDTYYKRNRNFKFFKQFIIVRLIAIAIALLCIILLYIGLKIEKRLLVEPFKYIFFLYVCFNVIFIKNIVQIDEGEVDMKGYIIYGCISLLFYGSYYILSLIRIRYVMKEEEEEKEEEENSSS